MGGLVWSFPSSMGGYAANCEWEFAIGHALDNSITSSDYGNFVEQDLIGVKTEGEAGYTGWRGQSRGGFRSRSRGGFGSMGWDHTGGQMGGGSDNGTSYFYTSH